MKTALTYLCALIVIVALFIMAIIASTVVIWMCPLLLMRYANRYYIVIRK